MTETKPVTDEQKAITVSRYWQNLGKTTADRKPGHTIKIGDSLICGECCWKDRECDERRHFHRESCPFCLGSGINASGDIGHD